MGSDRAVRAVFFDFGGVVARLDRELLAAFERRHGLPQGSFLKALYTIPEWKALEIGEGTEDMWMEAAKRKLDEFAGRVLPEMGEERTRRRHDDAAIPFNPSLREGAVKRS